MHRRVQVLLVSGSLRARSTNTAALRTAVRVAPETVAPTLYLWLDALPHFNPDDDHALLSNPVAELRRSVRAADALVFSTPEYAGALPGSFKNLLDWAIGDDQPGSISGKPVAWLNVSAQGAAHAHESLRRVLGYANAEIVEDACVNAPVTHLMVGDDGLIADKRVTEQITVLLRVLAGHCLDPRSPR